MKSIIPFVLLPFIALAGQLQVTMENDVFFDDDADYTHATRIEYVQKSGLKYGAQQQIYTPFDISTTDQVPGRHPYAGTLTGFIGDLDVHHWSERLTTYNDIELHLGVLGPSSHADDVQKSIHKLIGAHAPKGWEHQLHDELIVQAAYWRGYDVLVFGHEYGWNGRWVSEVGGLLGTLQVAPGINTEFKVGYGFGSAEPDREMSIRAIRRPSVSVFALGGCEGRWWIRNELLEGNAFYVHNHDTQTVDMEPLTGCLKAGAGFRIGAFEARMLWLWWTREYKTQESTPNYSSLEIGWNF